MSTPNFLRKSCLTIIYGVLSMVLSCTDHEIVGNLPESACKAVDGTDRLYPCEFVIEKITFLAEDGADLATVTGSMQSASLSRFEAKINSYGGNVAGQSGAATYEVRMTLKRVANPSFAVNEGYLIGQTHNSSGKMILHTPGFPGDTYGERTKIGAPLMLDMAIGESRDIVFEMTFPYSMVNAGMTVIPEAFFSSTSFFVDNDVTTLNFDRTTSPYRFVGSVVEAFYEKLIIKITN